eukprot:5743148-Amphidinium_carterae.1
MPRRSSMQQGLATNKLLQQTVKTTGERKRWCNMPIWSGFLVCQSSTWELPELFALSARNCRHLSRIILDDEAWLSDVQSSEASTTGTTLRNTTRSFGSS